MPNVHSKLQNHAHFAVNGPCQRRTGLGLDEFLTEPGLGRGWVGSTPQRVKQQILAINNMVKLGLLLPEYMAYFEKKAKNKHR